MTDENRQNVTDRPSLHLYLPESTRNEVSLACKTMNLIYERETNEELEKNRYLYPIIFKVGLNEAADLSYEEIEELKEEIDAAEK